MGLGERNILSSDSGIREAQFDTLSSERSENDTGGLVQHPARLDQEANKSEWKFGQGRMVFGHTTCTQCWSS
jgi:hypothetical protein